MSGVEVQYFKETKQESSFITSSQYLPSLLLTKNEAPQRTSFEDEF